MTMQDIRDTVLDLARTHYQDSDEPIYLAGLGMTLRNQSLWPIDGEKRSLKDWLTTLEPELRVVQNERSPARVAIVTPEKAELVEALLLDLNHSHLVNTLVRSVLLAFVVRGDEDAPVFLARRPPFKYTLVKPDNLEDFHTISAEFRIPGLKLTAVSKMAASEVGKLGSNIQRWADTNRIKLETLTKAAAQAQLAPLDEVAVGTMSALDRLLAAQRPEVRAGLVVPADIAVLLSRHR
jgi:hypothetical protein